MRSVLGFSFVFLAVSVLALLQGNTPAGSVVPPSEVSAVWGAACYTEDANAAKVTVCSSVCGTKMTWPRVGATSGYSAAGIACGSEPNCTYGGVGGTECSGSGGGA
jgi:hypothetical protein